MPIEPGDQLAHYAIDALIGKGGMGEVPCWNDEAMLQFRLGLVTQILLLPYGEKDGMRGLPSPIV